MISCIIKPPSVLERGYNCSTNLNTYSDSTALKKILHLCASVNTIYLSEEKNTKYNKRQRDTECF